jgi:DNA polymerase III subunit gamma/tau
MREAAPMARQSTAMPQESGIGSVTAMRAITPEPGPFTAVGSRAIETTAQETLTEGALARMPEAATENVPETAQAKIPETTPGPVLEPATRTNGAATSGVGVEQVRDAIVAALAAAGHSSAAQLLGAGEWKIEGASVYVSAPIRKKMISLTVNAAAEKIIRQELQRLGAPARFLVTPGEETGASVAKMPAAVAGSVQEAALAHPLVKRAQEIFKAEVRSVVDLREK